jgi:hypothetical protein
MAAEADKDRQLEREKVRKNAALSSAWPLFLICGACCPNCWLCWQMASEEKKLQMLLEIAKASGSRS